MANKRNWKFWTGRTILGLLVIGGLWLTNLIWFKPFNIKHFYDKVFIQLVMKSPELTTQVGVPVLYNLSKNELDDISDKKRWETFNKMKEDYKTLQSYDFESQSEENKLNTKILSSFLGKQIEGERFFYHDYPVNQMFGVQSNLPSLMESSHKLSDESDIEAYITRLSKFGIKFDQLLEGLKIREEKGIIPPQFIIDRVISEMSGFVGNKEKDSINIKTNDQGSVKSNILYANFNSKLSKIEGLSKEEKDAYRTRVEDQVRTTVFDAYNALILYFKALKPRANTNAGVWKLPDGDDFYQYQLSLMTTNDYTPKQVHQIGLSEVDRIKTEMWDILNDQGYADTTKTLGEIIQELNKEERFLYQNNDEGRKDIIEGYNNILDESMMDLITHLISDQKHLWK